MINDGTWHHVAVTWQPGNDDMLSNAVLFVDGDEETISVLNDIAINTSTSEEVHIGNIQNFNHFSGKIDDVRFYNRALTAEEIAEIAQ